MEGPKNVIASRYANMSDAEFEAAVQSVTRVARNDAEAAEARDRMMRLRQMGQGEAPSKSVRKPKARGGKIKGYKYGGKACRGRKANYKV